MHEQEIISFIIVVFKYSEKHGNKASGNEDQPTVYYLFFMRQIQHPLPEMWPFANVYYPHNLRTLYAASIMQNGQTSRQKRGQCLRTSCVPAAYRVTYNTITSSRRNYIWGQGSIISNAVRPTDTVPALHRSAQPLRASATYGASETHYTASTDR